MVEDKVVIEDSLSVEVSISEVGVAVLVKLKLLVVTFQLSDEPPAFEVCVGGP